MKRCFLLLLLIASSVKLMAQLRIVGGSAVDISQRPYQAAVFVDGVFNGGGVIISSRYILTAAHVVNGYSSSRIRVSVGHTNLNLDYNRLAVSKIYVHEYYFKEGGIPYNDVAVICLSEPLNFNTNVQPISLSSDYEYAMGLRAVVSGWGRINPENSEQSLNQLKKATVTILSSDNQNVVAEPSLSTVLHGDSGGPLTINQNGADILIGLVSWGNPQYPLHNPSYYVNVGSFRDWILSNSIFKDLSLTGSTQICNSSGTFTLNNLPAGATVQWSTSNAKELQIASGQGTARCTVVRGTLSLPGSQRVTATVNYLGASTTLRRTVQVGTPAPSIAGPYEGLHVVNEVRPCQTYTCQVHNTQSGVKRYDWWLYGDDFPTGLSIGNYASFSVSRPGEYTITCKQYQEGCGWSSEARLMVYARGNGCNSWGIKPNPTPGSIEVRPNQADGGEVSLMRSAKPSIVTLRQVHVFSADGRLVLERYFPAGTSQVSIDLSPLRAGTYHLLIDGTEHHVVIKE